MGFFDGGISGLLTLGSNILNAPFAKWASDRNNSFAESMANSSWTRGVADMKRAGINPILAASRGGASSPGGTPMDLDNIGEGVVSTALDSKRLKQDMAESVQRVETGKSVVELQDEQKKTQESLRRMQDAQKDMYATSAVGMRIDNILKSTGVPAAVSRREFEQKHPWVGKVDSVLARAGDASRTFRDLFMGGGIAAGALKYLFGKKERNFSSALNLKTGKWE